MKKRISNEIIIIALLEQGSIRAAASALGIGEATIYKRMKNETFMQQYKEAKAECIKAATTRLQRISLLAANTLESIMNDEEVTPQVRLNAANAALSHVVKMTEIAEFVDDIEELERISDENST